MILTIVKKSMLFKLVSILSTDEKRINQIGKQTIELTQRELDNKLSYKLHFMASAVKGLLKKQSIVIDKSKIYKVPFNIKSGEYNAWNKVFQSNKENTPYGMYIKSSTTLFMKFIVDLNVNYKNILHLRSEVNYCATGPMFQEGGYENAAWVEDITPVGKDKAIIGFASRVLDANGTKVIENKDYFMVLHVDGKTMEYLKSQQMTKKVNYRSWLIAPKYKDQASVNTNKVHIPKKMGKEYGWVSGDLNFVHTTNFLAKLFGFKRAFIQGLCTANYVLSNLPQDSRPEKFSINFIKPVYTDSQINIQYADESYKVTDASDQVLAHGQLN